MVCVSRSRLGRGSLTQFCIILFRSEMTYSVSQNVDTEMAPAPTSQAKPRDTDHLRPSNLAARTLRSVEHAPSKFGYDPCLVRRGLVAAVTCCVRKNIYSPSGQVLEQNKRSQSLVWVSTPQMGKTLSFSVFRCQNCRP